ncbi:Uu.00g048480.m01.CDS01 [Anthostomella pinea]|uniref:Uu.00g048480.m01.CDS01 n=1 Tax=Anthostomella pinea TaxID=933095 RepID=A0AAI8VBQ8_9PEZI|nr:Uu.00g048480.m01.CDS01 [Anthostomella pinea]
MSKPSMSEHLLESTRELYQRATECQFLELAGKGRLPRDQLCQWLSQDRLYAQAYVRFIGGLISRLRLPIGVEPKGTNATLQWRILALLQGCLAGIMKELQFFETTAKNYDLDLEAVHDDVGDPEAKKFGPCKATQEYIDLFDSFTARSPDSHRKSLLDGLVVLWATEKVYLDAWTNAKKHSHEQPDLEKDLDGGALRKALIPNWTSDMFRVFVSEIQICLDRYAASLSEDTEEVGAATSMTMFKKVLVLEEGFWPVVAMD